MSGLLIASVLTLSFSFALANEGAAPAEGKKEASKEEAKKAVPEWVEIQARLQTLKAKVAAKEKAVSDLIAAKKHETNPSHSVQIVNDMKREHKEMLEAAEEYERQRNLLRYRYPEKGMKDDRTYQRIEVKSLSDMETQVGMEGQLRGSIQGIRRQYTDPSKAPADVPVQKPKTKEEIRPQILEAPVMSK